MQYLKLMFVMLVVFGALYRQYLPGTGSSIVRFQTCDNLKEYYQNSSDAFLTVYDIVMDKNFYDVDNVVRAYHATIGNDEIGYETGCALFDANLFTLRDRYTELSLHHHLLVGAVS